MLSPNSAPETVRAEGHRVLHALRAIVQALRLASRNTEKSLGLSAAQLFVLRTVAANSAPMSINQLATATSTHQSSVSVVVKKLEKLELLSRKPARHDARCLEVSLTETGKARLRDLPPLIQDQFLEGFARMSEADRVALVTGLQAFTAVTGLVEAPPLFFEDPS